MMLWKYLGAMVLPPAFSGLLGFERVGGFARAGRAEQVAPRRQGQPPIARPRIIIKPERHLPGSDADPPMDLGVVRMSAANDTLET